jgi:adenylate cyclase
VDAPESPARGQLLLVDDSNMPRLMMANGLKAAGWGVKECASGAEALRLLRRETFDTVVCDLAMPEMDGFVVLAKAKEADPTLPVVVMLDREDDSQTVIRAVREGAFDVVDKKGADRRHLLSAVEHAVAHGRMLRENIRLNLELEMRVAETEEQKQLILEETRKSERLLMSILPKPIAERLKGKTLRSFADSYPDVTVLFADITGFSRLAAARNAGQLIDLLDEVFNLFDDLADRHGCEKIKTIGDAYMAAAGVPIPQMDHAQVVGELAIGMLQAIAPKIVSTGGDFNLRIGIHSGPVIAGVIGRKRPAFDLWGETVNIASRMEMHGVAGRIQVSDATHALLERRYDFDPRGEIDIKGHQKMKTWFLLGRKA